ncbi:MAG: tRNA pseudouridine(55) synthase TruB [Pseudomonadota bacterium]|nr:tRNA pseudouridine(55) synthase TruB [Pseudomonadota bacterium]
MLSGWIILDKPIGLGSTQAVAAVKRNLRSAGHGKGVKVGHGGTLDPLATGVLPIAVGEATKLCGRMLDASKIYAFTVSFGAETDTLDLEGAVIARCDERPSRATLAGVLAQFTGPIEQVPPAYSAIRIDGQRAYDRARAGEVVAMKTRAITVHSLTLEEELEHPSFNYLNPPPSGEVSAHRADGGGPLVNIHHAATVSPAAPSVSLREPPPPGGEDLLASATFIAHVSKGTYIRSLARDIARAAGSLGHVTMLRRLRAGPFTLSAAISLDMLNEAGKGAGFENILLPLEAGLDDIPALDLYPEQARAVRQGRVLTGLPHEDGLYWARSGNIPIALVQLSDGGLSVERGFNCSDVAE